MRLLALALWIIFMDLALAMKRRLRDDDIQKSKVMIQNMQPEYKVKLVDETECGGRILLAINKNGFEYVIIKPKDGQEQRLDEFFRV